VASVETAVITGFSAENRKHFKKGREMIKDEMS